LPLLPSLLLLLLIPFLILLLVPVAPVLKPHVSPAPRILLLVGGDPLFSAALRVIAQVPHFTHPIVFQPFFTSVFQPSPAHQSPLQTKITVHLVPLKQSAVAERIGNSCTRYRDTFLLPAWLATLSKFGTGSCDEQGIHSR
jgi:hypothetical protein